MHQTRATKPTISPDPKTLKQAEAKQILKPMRNEPSAIYQYATPWPDAEHFQGQSIYKSFDLI